MPTNRDIRQYKITFIVGNGSFERIGIEHYHIGAGQPRF